MNTDILGSISSMLGGQVPQKISGLLGESEGATRAALHAAIPALLAGVMQKTSDAGGASTLFRTVTSDTVDSGIMSNVTNLFGNRSNFESIVSSGDSFIGSLLGNRAGAVAHAVSQVSGVKPSSATALLAMGAPILLGFLKKQVVQRSLDGNGLKSMLLGQRQALQKGGLDDRILGALGAGNMQTLMRSFGEPVDHVATERATEASAYAQTVARERPTQQVRHQRSWWPTAAILALAALAIALLFNWLARDGDVQTAATNAAGELRVASLPARVYFDQGQAIVDAGDRQAIEAVANTVQVVGQVVTVTGFAERTQDTSQDLTLANNRAAAVRDALVTAGIPSDKIEIRPPEVAGTATDTEARRVEIALAQ
jgi:outer membrane protein OmpA-like peptidoglycan-associated protein